MKVTVVHNEEAGHSDVGRRELTRWIRDAGHEATFCDAGVPQAITRALRNPGDLVAIAGGDGSVRSVGKALLDAPSDARVPMTVLPMGTANNVATHFGLHGDLEALVAQWADGRHVPFDVGTVTTPWGRDVFFEACGFGAVAKTMAALTPVDASPSPDGSPRHELARDLEVARELLADHPSCPVRVSIDGRVLSRDVVVLEVMNIEAIGAKLALAPDADAGDGLLDVVLLDEDGRRALRAYLTARLALASDTPPAAQPRLDVPVHRARELTIAWPGSRLHVDDQIVPDEAAAAASRYWPDGTCEVTIGIRPGALTMVVPGRHRA